MLVDTAVGKKFSDRALNWLIGSALTAALLAIPHSILEYWAYSAHWEHNIELLLVTLVADTRYFFEQLMLVAALIFVAAKFLETRTTFAVTFDRVDSDKISVKGPDTDNVVWIGHRYGSELEAKSVAAMLENRLRESAA